MRQLSRGLFIAIAVIACAVLALKASVLVVQSGSWSQTGKLSSARAGASAALLQDGRLLITGGDPADGSGPLTSADIFATDGTISAAPPMINARTQHVSVALQDGRVLVAGGLTAGGSVTSTAEIYDPVAKSWTGVGLGMTEARSSATAAVLQDGRVVIAGGQNGSTVSSTIEIFDPVLGAFMSAAMMSTPRSQHAVAVLQNGRVMIVGGNNGTAPVASTDIFDPVTKTVSAGPNLAVARFGHSATTLLNGQVVVIGGNNGNADPAQMDLASAELFDPTAGTFTTLPSNLATPREDHLAFLLPNNNNVLIIGGTSAGTTIASAELFSQWQRTFAATGTMTTARSSATGSANQVNTPTSVMQRNGVLMIAGGTDASGNALNSTEAYGFPTVQTDQNDYAPGSVVVITGSGWQAGETVTLSFLESPLIDTHPTLTAVADANGNIFNNQLSPDSHDASIRFYLTAVGSLSGFQAQTTFTDAIKEYEASVSPTSDTAGHASAGYTLTITNDPTSTNDISSATIAVPSGYSSVALGTVTTSPAGLHWTASLTSGVITVTANAGPDHLMAGQSVRLALTATAPCTNGTYTWTTATSGNFTLVGSQPSVTISGSCTVPTTLVLNSVSPNSVSFGSTGPVTFTATLTRNDTSMGIVGATVNLSVDGGAAIPATTGAGGIATFTTYNPSALSVATHNVAASFTAATISGTTYAASTSNTQTLAVTKATPTITWANPADITYGTALSATQLNATASIAGTFSYTPPSGTILNAGSHSLHVDFTPSDTADYNPASTSVTINVKTAPLTATLTAADKTYDGTATEPNANMSCSVATVFAGDMVNCAATNGTFNTSQVATANQVTATVTISGTSLGNYTLGAAGTSTTSTTAMATAHIKTASLTATLTAADKTYDGTATEPNANMSCSVATVFAGDMVNCAATGGTFNTSQVATANQVTATVTISGTSLGNYTLGAAGTSTTSTTAMATAHITTASLTATLTAADKTYDGTATEPNANMSCSVATVFAGDMVNCAATGGTFNSKDVAAANQVTATVTISGTSLGNYTLGAAGTSTTSTTAMATAHIKTASLTATLTAADKTYDGTATEPNANMSCSVATVFAGDMVNCAATNGTFNTSQVATANQVTATVTISGTSLGNYTLGAAGTSTTSTTAMATAHIKTASLTATLTAADKTYDGTATEPNANMSCSVATVFAGDMVNCAATGGTFNTSQVATANQVTATVTISGTSLGNYTLGAAGTSTTSTIAMATAHITTASLTATLTAADKTYDGTATEPNANMSCSVATVFAGDMVNCAATGGTFNSKDVAAANQVTATVTISGTSLGNYTLGAAGTSTTSTTAMATAHIKTASLTATLTAADKTYDGTATEPNANMSCSVATVFAGDMVNCAAMSGTFNSKDVATANQVTATVTISGTSAGNYTLGAAGTSTTSTTAAATAHIKTAPLTVTATGIDKVYDATTTATVKLSDNRVAGDVFTDSYSSANFADKNAGTAKPVSVSGIAISGPDAGNYSLSNTSATTTANITPATTSTSVSSSPNPSSLGQGVTFMATVANTQTLPIPTGSVQFIIDGSNSGGPVALSAVGTASLTTSSLSVGSHTVAATYTNADGNFVNSNATATSSQQVNYGFVGLQAPYAPPPTTFNVTRTMPLKWQYTNSSGAVVNSAAANPVVIINGPYNCGGTDGAGTITVNDAGASGYQYDPGSNSWQFNWQIKGNVVGCYDIYVKSQQSGQTNGAFPISVVNK